MILRCGDVSYGSAARAVDPLLDPAERSLRRRLLVSAQKLNHDRKFHRYHPRPLRLRLR